MKIALLSCFYPYRGGISQFNACLYSELGREHDVKAFNFKRQYPEFLFPGKTQYVTDDDNAARLESESLLDSIDPFSWGRTFRAIRAWEPDLVITRYWMSFFAPSLGHVTRRLRKASEKAGEKAGKMKALENGQNGQNGGNGGNEGGGENGGKGGWGGCTVISILDNVVPHERRFFDTPLTKWFLKGSDGHLVMCRAVADDLLKLSPGAKFIERQHPLYTHFGRKLPREEAEARLGLLPGKRNLLFFGLIRDYKGLDILLEAFANLPEDYQLIVAGEPYGSFDKYRKIIQERIPGGADGAQSRVRLFLNYVKDSEVAVYFSAADLCVLPYRSATQSGISSVSYHFGVPMVVTDVGGLRETIGERGTGIVARECTPECVRQEIVNYFDDPGVGESCKRNIEAEKERLSWKSFCSSLLEFAENLRNR